MEQPLLNGTSASDDYPPINSLSQVRSLFIKESNKIWTIAGPIVFNIICMYAINSFTQIFIGHVSTLDLSAISVGSVIISFTFGFMLGMGSANETLCGQAFGAGQVHMLGIYMQRSCAILTVTGVLITPFYIFATPILKAIGQDATISEVAGKYCIMVIPVIYGYAIIFPVQKFLQAQSKVGVLAWIGFVALIIHTLLLWIFIWVFGWGLTGAAVAFDISTWIITVSQVVYVMGWCKEGWNGFSVLAFKDLWGFIRLSLSSGVMICLEMWYMTSLIILTGHLGNAEIAVGSISICMNINSWEAVIFFGINAAVGVRVSNELGSGHPRAAKFSVAVIVSTSIFMGLIFMAIIMISKDYFAVIFTSSKELQKAVAHLASLLGVTMVLNSVQPVLSGVAIGGGWQGVVAYINLGCYYIFGLPLGFLLGYKFKLGVEGIWGGMLCGTALQTLILLLIIWRMNWTKEVTRALERIQKWGGQEDEAPRLQI